MSDFSVYTAEQITDWMSQGTIDAAPSNIYVTVFDSGGTELDGSFPNARFETTTGTDWDEDADGTGFTNANNIDFGEAASDVTDVTDVALYDASTGGNEIARYQLTDAPFDVSAGTNLIFLQDDIDFDVKDRTE